MTTTSNTNSLTDFTSVSQPNPKARHDAIKARLNRWTIVTAFALRLTI